VNGNDKIYKAQLLPRKPIVLRNVNVNVNVNVNETIL